MKKFILILLAFALLYATNIVSAIAAFLDYDRVTTYVDNTLISAEKIPTIQYRGWYGSTSAGPWTVILPAVIDNLTITAPDPTAGSTLWYTVDATLDGMTSDKAVAKSKTVPFLRPAVPWLRGVR